MSAGKHKHLAAERARAPFDERAMTVFLAGRSREEVAVRQAIMDELDMLARHAASGARVDLGDGVEGGAGLDPENILPNEDHTLEEARLQTMKMLRFQYSRLLNGEDSSARSRRARMELMSLFDPAWFTRNGVHFGLWLGAVQGQGSREQVMELLPGTLALTLSGCFAMTEIGHGSFVRGIETEATYDPATETFCVNTPRLEATKWWIGGAAKTATHAAVFAQLILPDGSRPGVHTFVVPIRSLEDHAPLPGVRVGDCGAKFGRHGLDNGFIQFDHVKVPRSAMLCKYSTVSPEGAYSRRGRKQLQYGALIGGRAIMVTDSAIWLKAAVTIAVRYLALRRQGDPLDASGLEPQLLDFRTVQTRVMPLVATAYALNFTALYMQKVAPQAGLSDDDADSSGGGGGGRMTEEERIAALPDLHSTCAGLKAFSTWACYYGIDTLRQCLGGHGYSGYTALGRMFTDFAVQCTWEGDNTVMALQTARYLVRSYERLDAGEQLTGSVTYLASLPRINRVKRSWAVKTSHALRHGDLRVLLDAFRYLLAKKVERVSLHLRAERRRAQRDLAKTDAKRKEVARRAAKRNRKQKKKRKQLRPPAAMAAAGAGAANATTTTAEPAATGSDLSTAERRAWNAVTPELLDCSRAHCYYILSSNFVDAVESAVGSESAEERALAPSLDLLCRLFVLSSLSDWLDWFLATEYMNKKQMFLCKEGVNTLCAEARSIAVPAVDAFGLSDRILRSPLGRRDGDVYKNYFERVLAKPGAEERAKYYATQIEPLLRANL